MANEQSQTLKRVFLIDAMSHIFRAFFAPMGNRTDTLRTSAGMPTQGVFVFTNILRKLLDEKPDYIAAVFESEEKTFRHELSSDYKANRPDAPDDMKIQMPFIMRVCEVFNIPILRSSGYEADDVIGTLAIQAAEQGLQAVIVSNDKDMCQLVRDPHVICMRHNSQYIKRKVPAPPIEYCDEAWVRNKFGVEPKQIIDLLGLQGDAVDNIPGAPGIGEKGAVTIISTYGSVENAIEHAGEIKHKTYRESLQNNQEIIRQSVELATIKTDAPVQLDLEQLKLKTPNRAEAYQLFRELEFQALTREFADAANAGVDFKSSANVRQNYRVIKNRADLDALIRKLWETDYFGLAVDGRSPIGAGEQFNSFYETAPRFVAIATAAGNASVIDLENFAEGREAAIAPLRDTLSNGFLQKFVHDLKRTIAILAKENIELEGATEDTLLAAYLLDPTRSRYELNNLVREAIDAEPALEIAENFKSNFPAEAEIDCEKLSAKEIKNLAAPAFETAFRVAEAADFTARLAPVLRARLEEQGLEIIYETMELPLAPLLYKIEQAGLHVNVDVLRGLSAKFAEELEKLTSQIYGLAGKEFKIGSPKQVGEILESLNITKGKKTATGQISTSKDVLQELAADYELPRLILEYRELEKLKATYTDALPELVAEDRRIHGQLNQTVTATGRLSSSEPNLQNIPIRTELGQRIRDAFVPEPGNKLIAADYSQLELRLLAHVTKDAVMVDAFQSGDDIHTRTAELVFGARDAASAKEKRRLAKIVNFAIAYAVEPYGLSARTGLNLKESKKAITDYYETYKGVREYMDKTPEVAKENGFVTSIFGRRRPIPGINDRNHNIRTRAEREAINLPIQGCLPYETRVLTSAGYRAIGDLYLEGSDDLNVWTGTRFADFAVLNRGECELAELDLANGRTLRCDTRHEVLIVNANGYEWKKFGELIQGDKVCLSLPKEIEYGSAPEFDFEHLPDSNKGIAVSVNKIDEQFFYWLGYYFGDGWITHRPDDGKWSLNFIFGHSPNKTVFTEKLAECTDYYKTFGLRGNVRRHNERKATLTFYSKGFVEFLAEIGVNTTALAATKRIPDVVFSSPLSFRKAFLRGFLDADGYAGKNGAANPNIHLCQKEILADLMLLFRTAGVECKLRGAYEYRGKTSYQLDLVGGMLSRSIGFCSIPKVKIPNMNAPQFLIRAFLDAVEPAHLQQHSHKVLHSRLARGGTISIYTLAEMLEASGQTIEQPLYAWSELRQKRALGEIETTYTLSVDDALHRFDSEGVISKNTASDIVKLAMLKVDESIKREGLNAQIIMQVHDELLLEAPESEAEKTAAVAKQAMETAANLDVPLLVETGIGDSWMQTK